MLAAILILSVFADWVPARWPSADPKSLELLGETAVNCLLLDPPYWNASFVEAAAARHVRSLGTIHPQENAVARAKLAARLRMSAVVLEGNFQTGVSAGVRAALAGTRVAVIELPSRDRIRLNTKDSIVGTSDALWPGIDPDHGGAASGGPTSGPWVNTNAGFLRFLTAATTTSVWIGERPPPHRIIPAARYVAAVADAALAGARWIVGLDDVLARDLLAGDRRARATWEEINQCVRYFDHEAEWRHYRASSQFVVVQNAQTGLLSSGLVDMFAVQHIPTRLVPASEFSAANLRGARVVLNVNPPSLNERQNRELADFAHRGGLVVRPPQALRFPGAEPGQIVLTPQQIEQIQPLWDLAYKTTSRQNFGLRAFNAGTTVCDLRARTDGSGLLIHLLNYADYWSENVTLHVLGVWHRARLFSPNHAPRELPVYPVDAGTGIDIDNFFVVASVVVD